MPTLPSRVLDSPDDLLTLIGIQTADARNALRSEHLIFKYVNLRIGDCVAAMTLRAWIESKYGAKHWYLSDATRNGCAKNLKDLAHLTRRSIDWHWLDAADAPQGTPEFVIDRPSLWFWNSFFQHISFRLEFGTEPRYSHPIVFAPLLNADYSSERAMHPQFALDLTKALAEAYPGQVLVIADELTPHDLTRFRKAGTALVLSAPLPEVYHYIGNARVFIGADTGLSHVAGGFADVHQIALYSRENIGSHARRDLVAMRDHRLMLAALTGFESGCYSAFPNKADCHRLLFDNNGCDGKTLDMVMGYVNTIMQGE